MERYSQARHLVANDSALAGLIAPLDVRRFLHDYWPRRVFHAAGSPSRLPALFSAPELSSFKALTAAYRGWLGFGRGAESPRMISVQQVNPAHLYSMGLSIYLPDIEACVDGASEFLRELEAELGIAEGSARITVWASPQGDGAATHFDGEDVFSIQLAGSKRFEVAPMTEYANPVGSQFAPGVRAHDDMYPQADRGFPDVSGARFDGYDMRPGSVLFIPRGTWHRTSALTDSFAISIGINPPTVAESFLGQLRHVLLQDPKWREPLYGVRGDRQGGVDEALGSVLGTAARAVQAISAHDLIPRSDAERLRNIERATRFQRDPGTRMAYGQGAEARMLEIRVASLEGEQVTAKTFVPDEYAATMQWLAESKAAFTAGELQDRFPGVPFEQHRRILDLLTRARYLRVLWFPALPKD